MKGDHMIGVHPSIDKRLPFRAAASGASNENTTNQKKKLELNYIGREKSRVKSTSRSGLATGQRMMAKNHNLWGFNRIKIITRRRAHKYHKHIRNAYGSREHRRSSEKKAGNSGALATEEGSYPDRG